MTTATFIATEKTYRRIFTCKNKECKQVFAYDYSKKCINTPDEKTLARYDELGRRYEYLYEYVRIADGVKVNRDHDSRCPQCNKFADFNDVKAVKGEHKCGARCTNAKGGDCDCQCNGKNHGQNHL